MLIPQKMKHTTYLKIIISSLVLTTAYAQDITRTEFESLLKRVQVLEEKLIQTQEENIKTIATEVVARISSPEKTNNESNIVENVISLIQSREESVTYPWMDITKWAKIEKGMPVESVLAILGKPYTNEPSLRKRIDYVFTYSGRRIATNDKIEGVIRFYKNKVASVDDPK